MFVQRPLVPHCVGAVLQALEHHSHPLKRIKYFRAAKAIRPTKNCCGALGIETQLANTKKPAEYSEAHRIQSQSMPWLLWFTVGFSIGFAVWFSVGFFIFGISPRGTGFQLAGF